MYISFELHKQWRINHALDLFSCLQEKKTSQPPNHNEIEQVHPELIRLASLASESNLHLYVFNNS